MGKIVWLASYPKSGNTWLRVFLHNLIRQSPAGHDINRLADLTIADSAAPLYQRFLQKPVVEASDGEIARLRRDVQEMVTTTVPGIVYMKTHNAFVSHLGWPLISMEHTAGAVYLVRNPLDLVLSHADHYGHSIDEAIHLLAGENTFKATDRATVYEIHSSWSRHVRSWTMQAGPGLLVLRYEDLLEQPQETFSKLVAFLRLPADLDRIRHAVERSSFAALRKMEDERGFAERQPNQQRFFRQGKAGGWRQVLSPAQVASIVSVHEQEMRRFGYWPA